jgi:UDP-glucuronate 4-epimerase
MRYLITGTAGFIGFHLADRLLGDGHEVLGVDGMTPFYDVELKEARHARLRKKDAFRPCRCMLEDLATIDGVVLDFKPEVVVHLAAQAGVRYSLENPRVYINSNIVGTFNVLDLCRRLRPHHLLVASTSSVYGITADGPLTETSGTDRPVSLYAASKKSAEIMAHCYSHLWDIPTTVFRFFTVYGPWGRPDMAPFRFVQRILAGQPIDIYNHGRMERDFTYIDDLVEAIVRLCGRSPARGAAPAAASDATSPSAPYRIVNIGGGRPVGLLAFIEEIERAAGRPAKRNYMDMQMGDVPRTEASTELLQALTGYTPGTPLSQGVPEFVRWYRDYYGV